MGNRRGKTSFFIGIFAFGALVSCGGEPDFLPANQPPGSNITLVGNLPDERANVIPHSYIVVFRNSLAGESLRFASYFQEYQAHYLTLAETFMSDSRVKDIRFLTALDLSAGVNEAALPPEFGLPRSLQLAWNAKSQEPVVGVMTRVDFSDDASAKSSLKEWDDEGRIWFAEPNYLSQISADTMFEDYATSYKAINVGWHSAINLVNAFTTLSKRTTTDKNAPSDQDISNNRPIVAVLDSGMDYEHPSLKDSRWVNPSPNVSGCSDDVYGCNTTAAVKGSLGDGDVAPIGTSAGGEKCPTDSKLARQCPHGTHVAGIIAAKPGSLSGESGSSNVGGVCPVCVVLPIRIVQKLDEKDTDGSDKYGINDSSIIAGLKYITRFRQNNSNAVRVVNSSFGKYQRSKAVGLLVRILRSAGNGIILIGAASNEDSMSQSYPGAFPDAIAVANLDANDKNKKSESSNFGRWVDISAPGTSIYSTVPGGIGKAMSGTSMASPVVAGLAGLIVARHPDISFSDLRAAIINTANPNIYDSDGDKDINRNYYFPLGSDGSREPLLGSGIADADAGVQRKASTGIPTFTGASRVNSGCSVVNASSKHITWPWLLLTFPGCLAIIAAIRKRRT